MDVSYKDAGCFKRVGNKKSVYSIRINGLRYFRLKLLAQLHKVFVEQWNGFNSFQVIEYTEVFIW